jgi:2-keto-3-deoxy-L-rhamnonate aldolase RhmA
MLQIEHVDAVPQIEQILDVREVDAIVIGPYDLSASMGRPGEIAHPDVSAMIDKLAIACNERRMPWGVFAPDAATAKNRLAGGASVIALATDTMQLWRGARAALADLRSTG